MVEGSPDTNKTGRLLQALATDMMMTIKLVKGWGLSFNVEKDKVVLLQTMKNRDCRGKVRWEESKRMKKRNLEGNRKESYRRG